MKLLFFLTLFLSVTTAFGQQTTSANPAKNVSATKELSFDEYCIQYAATILEIPTGKSVDYPIAGEVDMATVANPTYLNFGVAPKEEATQYFTIRNTSKLLKVESLYRLRLSYALSLQKL